MKRVVYVIIAILGVLCLNSCEKNPSNTPEKGVLDGTTWEGTGLISNDRNVFTFANCFTAAK